MHRCVIRVDCSRVPNTSDTDTQKFSVTTVFTPDFPVATWGVKSTLTEAKHLLVEILVFIPFNWGTRQSMLERNAPPVVD